MTTTLTPFAPPTSYSPRRLMLRKPPTPYAEAVPPRSTRDSKQVATLTKRDPMDAMPMMYAVGFSAIACIPAPLDNRREL